MPVNLDPDAATVFKAFQEAGRPPYETVSPAEARELYLKARFVSNPEPPELKSVQPLAIPAPHGSIPARVYTPIKLREANGLAPCLVFFHGGGFVIGNLDSHDVVCRKLAGEAQPIVIPVDYRLAPEHKFPAGVEDVVTATKWVADNARQLGIDASRLSVGGDSAGGNLAAVVAISARDGNGPAIAGRVLIYPDTDSAMTHPSHGEPETSILLTHSVIRWFRDNYLNGAADVDDWRASPARAKSLTGLPPAYVLTAGADPLRDEGDEYAKRLKEAGVPVTYRTFPGQFHGFFTMGKLLQQANVAARAIGDWLMAHEWVTLANLFLLLTGFALLSRHFEESRIPDEMPALLSDDWTGGLALLCLVFVLSSFLDNIAAALIGGTVARHVFKGKVHIGYLAAIVAASNAGR